MPSETPSSTYSHTLCETYRAPKAPNPQTFPKESYRPFGSRPINFLDVLLSHILSYVDSFGQELRSLRRSQQSKRCRLWVFFLSLSDVSCSSKQYWHFAQRYFTCTNSRYRNASARSHRSRIESILFRYARLFRKHASHFNSDVNVGWSRLSLVVTYRGVEVFTFSSRAKDVKKSAMVTRSSYRRRRWSLSRRNEYVHERTCSKRWKRTEE